MGRKLFQHLLIWLAASAAIVLGMSWGHAVGFLAHRIEVRAMAWLVATVALVFSAALVQRAPTAIVTLLVLCVALFGFGVWLLATGARGIGVGYMAIGATYVVGLGPACLRWATGRD